MCTCFVCNCIGEKSLYNSRVSVQVHSFRLFEPHIIKNFWMPEREFDHLPYDLYFPAKAANILVVGFVVSFFTPSGISENSTEVFLVMMTASFGSISTILNTTIWGRRYGSTSMIGTESFFMTGKSIRPAII